MILICALIFGLLIGSFLNVVIIRLPQMLHQEWHDDCTDYLKTFTHKPLPKPFNLILPRSQCVHCQHPLRSLDNIPILSYFFLLGKCRYCAQKISGRYAFIELLTALLSMLSIFHFGLNPAGIGALILTWSLIASSFIDFDHKILPDVLILPLLWLGLWFNFFTIFTDLHSAVLGASLGYLSLWSIYWIFKLITKKEGMGYGDFKLLAVLGAWLGYQALPLIILISALGASIVGIMLILLKKQKFDHPLPFGPYLSIAGYIALLWAKPINTTYLQFFTQ